MEILAVIALGILAIGAWRAAKAAERTAGVLAVEVTRLRQELVLMKASGAAMPGMSGAPPAVAAAENVAIVQDALPEASAPILGAQVATESEPGSPKPKHRPDDQSLGA